MERCLVLSARQYDFADDKGKQVAGVTVTYLMPDDLPSDNGTRGCPPLSISAQPQLWPQLGTLPGYYDVDFRQRPGPKGKPVLMLTGARYVAPLALAHEDAK